jgi:glycerol-3-phosphate acyltransferase PlsY
MGQISAILVCVFSAYLLGSIPFSQLIAWSRRGLSLREVGEGSVGSRNVWHVVGPTWGVLAAALDALKGLGALGLAGLARLPLPGVLLCGLAALIGHQYPIFLRGRGGKGLATALGVMVGVSPLPTLGGLAVFGAAYRVFHDFNPAVALGIVAIVVLPALAREPVWVPAYALTLALCAAFKKVLDRPHEQQVWAHHPWGGRARPGFHGDDGDGTGGPDSPPE